MKERIINKLLKLLAILCVLIAIFCGANILEGVTGVEKEFWWETICLVHISINLTNKLLGDRK